MEKKVIDIKYKEWGLAGRLSNLARYTIFLDGIEYSSIEAFFACLRHWDEKKKLICTKTWGNVAHNLGHVNKYWMEVQRVNYLGNEIDRHSDEYNLLITSAYDALYENLEFRKALEHSEGYELTHSIGKSDKRKSLLTEREFIGQLNRLRNKKNERKFFNLLELLCP